MELPRDVNDLVDGVENMGKTSFDDLPDDILINIFKFLDLPSRLRLRLNKRLDKIHRSIKMKIELLEVKITNDQYELMLDTSDGRYLRNYDDFNLLENTLRGLFNTLVDRLCIKAKNDVPSEKVACVINILSNFDTNHLSVEDDFYDDLRIPQVSISTLLTLAENAGNIDLGIICDSVSAQELCTLRKTMLEGNCKLKSFFVRTDEYMTKFFLKECFGVTVEDGIDEDGRRTKIFRTANESVELFSDNVFYDLTRFEGGLLTEVTQGGFCPFISFKKDGAKPDDKYKVKMNHPYVDE